MIVVWQSEKSSEAGGQRRYYLHVMNMLASADLFYPQVKRQEQMTKSPVPLLAAPLCHGYKTCHNIKRSLLIFFVQIPFKGFCKDQFWNALYRWKSLYVLMKAFVLWQYFTL